MKNYFEDFRLNIKYYRNKKNMSQSDLAIKADCSNGLIGNIEAGKVHPSFDTILSIAESLDVHPADLFLRNSSTARSEIRPYIEDTLQHILNDLLEQENNR